MKSLLVATLLVAAAFASDAPENPIEGVTDLTVDNWASTVGEGSKAYIIEFYAPWCGWCKRLVPEWTKLGAAVGNHADVAVGKFDATQANGNEVASKYGVQGFPTIILVAKDGTHHEFQGQRQSKDFLSFITDKTGASF